MIQEGIRSETILKTGSTLKEVLNYYSDKITNSEILEKLELSSNKFFLVSAHREENVDIEERLNNLVASLEALNKYYKLPILFSTHPRTKKRLEEIKFDFNSSNIKFIKALGFSEYVKLQQEAFCIISDSGTITEEASIMNLPAMTIRQAHERPEGMDQGVLVMSDISSDGLIRAVEMVTTQHSANLRSNKIVSDYDEDKVSIKVARIILSYTDYVNRTVWRQQH